MFSVIISADETAWETELRMRMIKSRFGEYSGDEFGAISLTEQKHLDSLERVQTLLMYEGCVDAPHAETVRIGLLRNIRVQGGDVTFRFTETGRVPYSTINEYRHRLQISEWELNRTHWAVKDGDIPQDVLSKMILTPKSYDVVLSFAGEDRGYVEEVADFLIDHSVKVFYDKYEQATLWGKNLAEHFESIYRQQARYCVMFISSHYAEKMWTRHEKSAALARALAEKVEYVLPARFDDTEIPGLIPTIAYQDLRQLSPVDLGKLILQKLGRN
jgi:TIR domain